MTSSVAASGADGSHADFTYFLHDPLGVVLVRRGGYAVGLARDGRFVATKVGTRYVQSRTAAGGWSQQRFARRRHNQADALADAVAAYSLRILLGDNESPGPGAPDVPNGLVVGGDRTLVGQVLADSRLRRWPTGRGASCTTCPTRAATSSTGPWSAAALSASI